MHPPGPAVPFALLVRFRSHSPASFARLPPAREYSSTPARIRPPPLPSFRPPTPARPQVGADDRADGVARHRQGRAGRPHLHRDWVGLPLATSAPGLGSPHLPSRGGAGRPLWLTVGTGCNPTYRGDGLQSHLPWGRAAIPPTVGTGCNPTCHRDGLQSHLPWGRAAIPLAVRCASTTARACTPRGPPST